MLATGSQVLDLACDPAAGKPTRCVTRQRQIRISTQADVVAGSDACSSTAPRVSWEVTNYAKLDDLSQITDSTSTSGGVLFTLQSFGTNNTFQCVGANLAARPKDGEIKGSCTPANTASAIAPLSFHFNLAVKVLVVSQDWTCPTGSRYVLLVYTNDVLITG